MGAVIAAAIGAAGNVHKSEQASRHLNQRRMPSSTFSTRLTHLDVGRLLAAMEQELHATAIQALRSLAPDNGLVLAILDGHGNTYYQTQSTNKAIPLQFSRQSRSTRPSSDNKKSPYVDPFLVGTVVWWHKGGCVQIPILIRYLHPHQHAGRIHMQWLLESLGRMRVKPSCILADRAYDSADVRDAVEHNGVSLICRLRYGKGMPRSLELRNGGAMSMHDLMEETAYGYCPHVTTSMDRDGQQYLWKARVIEGRIRGEAHWQRFCLQACAQVMGGPRRKPRLRHAPNRSMVLVIPPDVSAKVALHLYRMRWTIECLFQLDAITKPANRSKRIEHLVVHVATRLAALARATLLVALSEQQGLRTPVAFSMILGNRVVWAHVPDFAGLT